MHFIVTVVRPQGSQALTGHGDFLIGDKTSRDQLKKFHTDAGQAADEAEALAAQHPGIQFGVFAPVDIYETLPAKVIRKKLNSNGEVVVAKEGEE